MVDTSGWQENPLSWDDGPGRVQSQTLEACRYISSPTMGRPGHIDALDYVDIMDDIEVRDVLKRCIRMARAAVEAEAPNV